MNLVSLRIAEIGVDELALVAIHAMPASETQRVEVGAELELLDLVVLWIFQTWRGDDVALWHSEESNAVEPVELDVSVAVEGWRVWLFCCVRRCRRRRRRGCRC